MHCRWFRFIWWSPPFTASCPIERDQYCPRDTSHHHRRAPRCHYIPSSGFYWWVVDTTNGRTSRRVAHLCGGGYIRHAGDMVIPQTRGNCTIRSEHFSSVDRSWQQIDVTV